MHKRQRTSSDWGLFFSRVDLGITLQNESKPAAWRYRRPKRNEVDCARGCSGTSAVVFPIHRLPVLSFCHAVSACPRWNNYLSCKPRNNITWSYAAISLVQLQLDTRCWGIWGGNVVLCMAGIICAYLEMHMLHELAVITYYYWQYIIP